MKLNYTYITIPFCALVFVTFLFAFGLFTPVYCWMACLQPEVSCLATLSYTFGLVPATSLAASSALSGCLALSDICEISCAKRSELQAYSLNSRIVQTCEIYRNGTKIHPYEIIHRPELANPYHLDAHCRPLPNSGTSRYNEYFGSSTRTPTAANIMTEIPPSTTISSPPSEMSSS